MSETVGRQGDQDEHSVVPAPIGSQTPGLCLGTGLACLPEALSELGGTGHASLGGLGLASALRRAQLQDGAAMPLSARDFGKRGKSHKSSDLFRKMATARAWPEVKTENAQTDLEDMQSRLSDKPQEGRR